MSDEASILAERQGPIGIVTLNRPERLNAYTPDMGDELVGAFRAFNADEAIRAIVVTGAGTSYCAGADKDCLSGKPGKGEQRIGEEYFLRGFVRELLSFETPTIAAVNGRAIGIGATMLLLLDVRVAASTASFSFPFCKLGIMPGMGSTLLLPHLIGTANARQVFLTGGTLDAQQALKLGLVTDVVDSASLLDRTLSIAHDIAACRAPAVAACKQALVQPLLNHLESVTQCEQEHGMRLAHNAILSLSQ